MTSKRKLRDNSIMGSLIVILFLFLSLKSCIVNGQSMSSQRLENNHAGNPHIQIDSATETINKPLYLGYELALAAPFYTLKSDLPELNNLHVGNVGLIVGGVVANKFGKLKGNAGLYYSNSALPYTFDLFTGGVSANVYLLRIRHPKYHTIEPYCIGGISQQHVKFYGNYLDGQVAKNHSTSEEQFLGRRVTTQFNVGLGAEYQLENDNGDFIHLFAEVVYGVPFANRCTREAFDRTHIKNPFTISVGISFGKIKESGK